MASDVRTSRHPRPLYALTLWRPWSHALLCSPGECAHPKNVENRAWVPPLALLGRYVAIHAGKKYDDHLEWPGGYIPEQEPAMCIVGVARLVGVVDRRPGRFEILLPTTTRTQEEVDRRAQVGERLRVLHKDPWWVGPVGLLFEEKTRIEPVPCKGAQQFWIVPPDEAELVRRRWKEARSTAA